MIGAARVETTDEDWFNRFRLLAGQARYVFLIPGVSEGTLREIKWIREQGLLEKTFFLQPPRGDSDHYLTNWQEARDELAKMGLQLPEFKDSGQAISLANDGRIGKAFELSRDLVKALADLIRSQVPRTDLLLWPTDFPYETDTGKTC
jgi:hypothetical protein